MLIPSWEDSILLVAAHIATKWEFRLCDINDLHAIVSSHGPSLDWDYIFAQAEKNNLTRILGMLMAESRRTCDSNIPYLPTRHRRYFFIDWPKCSDEIVTQRFRQGNLSVAVYLASLL